MFCGTKTVLGVQERPFIEQIIKLLIAFYLPAGILAAAIVAPCPGSIVYTCTV
jgi:hypothetical protein